MDSRQERIQLLVRMNARRAALPAFLAVASRVVGEIIEADSVLSVPSTDEAFEDFRRGYQNSLSANPLSYRRFFRASEETRVLDLVDCLASRFANEPAVWLTRIGNEPIAIRINTSKLLKSAMSVIELDGDSLAALSENRLQGLMIDHNLDDPKQAYEVAVWGDTWSFNAFDCATRS